MEAVERLSCPRVLRRGRRAQGSVDLGLEGEDRCEILRYQGQT